MSYSYASAFELADLLSSMQSLLLVLHGLNFPSLFVGADSGYWTSSWHSIQWAAATFARTFTNSGTQDLVDFFLYPYFLL